LQKEETICKPCIARKSISVSPIQQLRKKQGEKHEPEEGENLYHSFIISTEHHFYANTSLMTHTLIATVTAHNALIMAFPQNSISDQFANHTISDKIAVAVGKFPNYTQLIAGVALGLLTLAYLSYRWLLPQPIPGIPYNRNAASSIFGDMPALIKHVSQTKEVFSFLHDQNIKLNAPVVQVFAQPFARPWVVMTDFRESQDVLVRRTKEFDRSNFFKQVFSGILPYHHIIKKTTDPEFKAHRKLLQDLMAPNFLNEVATPQIYEKIMNLVMLWREKARLAQEHAFAANEDVYHAALDAVWAFTFGVRDGENMTEAQVRLLSATKSVAVNQEDNSEAVVFPVAKDNPTACDAVLKLIENFEYVVTSPIPQLADIILRMTPSMRKANSIKVEFIRSQLEDARQRFTGEGGNTTVARSALENMMHRELVAAEKEGRTASYHSRDMYDEVRKLSYTC
jgi:hypothetical protein